MSLPDLAWLLVPLLSLGEEYSLCGCWSQDETSGEDLNVTCSLGPSGARGKDYTGT